MAQITLQAFTSPQSSLAQSALWRLWSQLMLCCMWAGAFFVITFAPELSLSAQKKVLLLLSGRPGPLLGSLPGNSAMGCSPCAHSRRITRATPCGALPRPLLQSREAVCKKVQVGQQPTQAMQLLHAATQPLQPVEQATNHQAQLPHRCAVPSLSAPPAPHALAVLIETSKPHVWVRWEVPHASAVAGSWRGIARC